jgi:hypothetical protein
LRAFPEIATAAMQEPTIIQEINKPSREIPAIAPENTLAEIPAIAPAAKTQESALADVLSEASENILA